jgi:hypothetical protein
VADKIEKGRRVAVFLPHKQERQTGGQERHARGQFQGLQGDQPAQALAPEAVSHLVVVLGKDHEALGRNVPGRGPVPPLPVGRILPGINEPLAPGLGQLCQAAEIFIIAASLAGEQGVQRVVEIVVPVRVQIAAPQFPGPEQAHVV